MRFYRKKSKYRAVRQGGFPSRLEWAVHQQLLLLEKAGEIKDIKRQQAVPLGSRIWKCDFSYYDLKKCRVVYAEAKGFVTREFLWIKEMWKICGLGRLEVWRGTWTNPFVADVIETGDFKLNNKTKNMGAYRNGEEAAVDSW
jgi:hypothetical protein